MKRMSLIILASALFGLAGCGATKPADLNIARIIAEVPPAGGIQAARVYDRSALSIAGMPAAVRVGERPWVAPELSGTLTIWIYADNPSSAGAFAALRQANPLPVAEAGIGEEAYQTSAGAAVWTAFRRCQAVALLRLEGRQPGDTRRYLADLDQALRNELCP